MPLPILPPPVDTPVTDFRVAALSHWVDRATHPPPPAVGREHRSDLPGFVEPTDFMVLLTPLAVERSPYPPPGLSGSHVRWPVPPSGLNEVPGPPPHLSAIGWSGRPTPQSGASYWHGPPVTRPKPSGCWLVAAGQVHEVGGEVGQVHESGAVAGIVAGGES